MAKSGGFKGFPEDLFRFLEELSQNNNKAWFDGNKARYKSSVVEPMTDFIVEMGERLRKVSGKFVADPRPNGGSMFRIYRDTRFSKDKRPYKENVGCHFRHVAAKDAHGLGFYLHLQPGNVFAGAGIWMPPGAALEKIRTAIAGRPKVWGGVVGDKKLVKRFGGLEGESLKRPPKGFDADAPYIDDIKRKSFFVLVPLTRSLALSQKLPGELAKVYGDASPLMKFLAKALDLAY